MKRTACLWLVALLVPGPGCALVHDAASLTVFKTREMTDDFFEEVRNRKWAEHTWEEVRASTPNVAYSEDYARGFQDGFAHYLFRGGSGEPPALPPRHYRQLSYQTPTGYRAIEDWFAGFRHGAYVAHQGGYRRWVTGPSSLVVPSSGPLPPLEELPMPAPVPPEAVGRQTGTPATAQPEVLQVDFRWRPEPGPFAVTHWTRRFDEGPGATIGRPDPP